MRKNITCILMVILIILSLFGCMKDKNTTTTVVTTTGNQTSFTTTQAPSTNSPSKSQTFMATSTNAPATSTTHTNTQTNVITTTTINYVNVIFKDRFETIEKTVVSGERIDAIEPSDVIGYDFKGWFMGDSEFDFESGVQEDVVLEPLYQKREGSNSMGDYVFTEEYELLSPKVAMDAIQNGYLFVSFDISLDSLVNEETGFYLEVLGRHVIFTMNQFLIYSLYWQDDTENIPLDFVTIKDESGQMVNDILYGNGYKSGSIKSEYGLRPNTTYTVTINLSGRYYQKDNEKSVEFLEENGENVSISSYGNHAIAIRNVSLIKGEPPIETSILNKNKINLFTGDIEKADLTILEDTYVISAESSDVKVASVDTNLLITAVGAGSATITIYTSDSKIHTININVEEKPMEVTYTVSKDGTGDFDTLKAAFDSIPRGSIVTIYLKKGEYEEVINLNARFESVTIVGESRDECIIINRTGVYENSPLLISGNFRLENLSLMMTLENRGDFLPTYDSSSSETVFKTFGGYALHIDWQSYNPEKEAYGLVKNCYLYSEALTPVGMGTTKNQTVEFLDCDLIRNTTIDEFKHVNYQGALLCHSATTKGNPNQTLKLTNCYFESNYGRACHVRGDCGVTSDFTLVAIGNVFYSKEEGYDSLEYWKKNSILSDESRDNTVSSLNKSGSVSYRILWVYSSIDGKLIDRILVESGKQPTLDSKEIPDGYMFKGYYLEDGTNVSKITISENLKVIAKYIKEL